MTLKGDAKFKRKPPCGFKNGIRNLFDFHTSSRWSKNLHFDSMLFSKAYKDLDENIQKSYISWQWRVMQTLKKNWVFGFKNDMKNFLNFHSTTRKYKTFTLMGYFCPKYMRFELKKYRRVIFRDTEQWSNIWINPNIVIPKMAWGIRNFH